MKKILFLILFSALILNSAEITGIVTKIYDGDTISIRETDLSPIKQGTFRIRFANIDAPESSQEYGEESKKTLSKMIEGKEVTIFFNKVDIYGRLVGHVYCEGVYVNAEMVKSGAAWSFMVDSDHKIAFSLLEAFAMKNKIGLFQNENPIRPSEYRKLKK